MRLLRGKVDFNDLQVALLLSVVSFVPVIATWPVVCVVTVVIVSVVLVVVLLVFRLMSDLGRGQRRFLVIFVYKGIGIVDFVFSVVVSALRLFLVWSAFVAALVPVFTFFVISFGRVGREL